MINPRYFKFIFYNINPKNVEFNSPSFTKRLSIQPLIFADSRPNVYQMSTLLFFLLRFVLQESGEVCGGNLHQNWWLQGFSDFPTMEENCPSCILKK